MIHPTFHCKEDEMGNVVLRNCTVSKRDLDEVLHRS